MYLSEYAEAQRLDRVTARARADRQIRPRLNAAGEPPPPESETREEERRGTHRVAMTSEILVRRVGAFPFSVGLGNMSAQGCQIELVDGYEIDDSLVARFPQLEPLGARVCWADRKHAGMEFSKTIHPAVFTSLVKRMKDTSARG
jgi:hypothetical protein